MNILFVAPYYPPEIGGAAHLISELAASLGPKGHEVTVLTGYPRYNMKSMPSRYRRSLWMSEIQNGISVKRVRIPPLPRASKIARGIEHLFFGLWLGGLCASVPRADVVITFSPPLPVPWLVCLVCRIRRIPVVVSVQDLFPREAIELGMLTNPLLIRLFEAMEHQVYSLAARVTVHSPGNKEHVVRESGEQDRVHVVGNWADLDRVSPGHNDNGFSREHGLGGRFVVSYAGTMGWAQDMRTIVRSAARLTENSQILFLLVGDGVEKPKAQALSRQLGLENILWLPTQPWSLYPEILSASDVGLINLHPELRTPVVPSKLLNIMAAARPVIASLPAESDARRIIEEAGSGICVDAGDEGALADAIRKLALDRGLGREMGRRGREYAEKHFSREGCTAKIEAVLKSAIGDLR